MTARTRRRVAEDDRRSWREPFVRPPRAAAGALLLVALVFAPWCWGCAWPSGLRELDLILLGATLSWLIAFALRRERIPRLLMAAISLILMQGWALTLNSRGLFAETTFYFAPLEQPLAGWPGSVERDLSWDTMAHVTALLGAALAALSLGRERAWRRRFGAVIVATAMSLVLFGCAQRWSHAEDIFWGTSRHLDYFFATFRNVTNAGEYLNLAVPPALAMAWNARGGAPLRQALAVCALAILIAGTCVCGSKASPLIALAVVLAFLLVKRGELAPGRVHLRPFAIVALVIVVAIASIAWGAGLGVAQDRWQRLFEPSGEVTMTNRLLVDRMCLSGAGEAGWFGFGPGTFPVVFTGLEDPFANPPPGRWLAAHNDYLQTMLEWGAVGALAWSAYFFGAFARLTRGLHGGDWREEDRTAALGCLLALGAVGVMALVDFPLQAAPIQLEAAVLGGMGWGCFAWPRARKGRP